MKGLNDLFLPFPLAKMAKEKGFNHLCFGYYQANHKELILIDKSDFRNVHIPAPLYQQIIDWFDKKGVIIYWNMLITGSWEYHIGPQSPEAEIYIKTWNHSKYEYSYADQAMKAAIEEAFKLIYSNDVKWKQ